MNLNNLYYFYISAKNHSISKAGEHLNITQSAVSRSIIALEKDLNVKLLIRRKKGVELTEQGARVYDLARNFFLGYSNLENSFKENVSNHLRVATTAGVATFWIPQIIKFISEKIPDLRLTIVTHTEDLSLEQREADVLIGSRQSLSPDLNSTFLKTSKSKLYASKAYIKAHGMPKNKEELKKHKIIAFSTDQKNSVDYDDWFLEDLDGCEPYLRVNLTPALLEFLREGAGIMMIPEEIVREEDVCEIKLDGVKPLQLDYYISYLKTSSKLNLIKKFEKVLLDINYILYKN